MRHFALASVCRTLGHKTHLAHTVRLVSDRIGFAEGLMADDHPTARRGRGNHRTRSFLATSKALVALHSVTAHAPGCPTTGVMNAAERGSFSNRACGVVRESRRASVDGLGRDFDVSVR